MNDIDFTTIESNFANRLSKCFSQFSNNLPDFLLRKKDAIHSMKSQKGAPTSLFMLFLHRLSLST